MRKIAKETEAYLEREHLQDDTDATLNIISTLPSCHYRIYLYGRYHELVKKQEELIQNWSTGNGR